MNIDEFALKGETFKPLVAPFEKYLVSDYGRVWNSKTKKPVALSKCYFQITDQEVTWHVCCIQEGLKNMYLYIG